ncbi:hypothetical protein [Coprobacter sp.]|jgi:hypothetical protein|uniref:hypothetical protein n=1 Tax=Coprobacter sp. TaxID=1941478 RepID=UPI0025ED1667|nr:hypothetical protein [uncultured Coprobacter sp.]
MKDKDFDFDQVGKRLPYRVDEEVLQRVTRNVLETCKQEKFSRKSGFRRNYFFYMLGSVAAILLLVVYIGAGHKKEVSDQLRIAEISADDSLKEFYPVSDQYVGNVFNEVFQRDSSLEFMLWEETLAENFKYSQTEKDLPMDELIDKLSDEDLMFLTEITGGTVVDQWYN